MIERFTKEATDSFTVRWTAREHQWRGRKGVGREARDHRTLIVHIEMEEAVPCKQGIEASTERQLPHVGDKPFGCGKARAAHTNQRRG